MTTTYTSNATTVFLLLISILVALSYGQEECDQCQFTSDDAADCKVYGAFDGELVAWSKASDECLANYGNTVASIDPSSIGCGTDPPNANTFVNSVRFGSVPNSVLGGLGTSEGGFFVQDTSGLYIIKDEITVDGVSYNCKEDESRCYNDAMKSYFAVEPGRTEMAQVCDQTINKLFLDREIEQVTTRNRICQDIQSGETTGLKDVCGELVDEIESIMNSSNFGNQDCAKFSFGSAGYDIPGCDGNNDPDRSGGVTSIMVSNTVHYIAFAKLMTTTAVFFFATGIPLYIIPIV